MTGDPPPPSHSCAFKFCIHDFGTSELPPPIKARWAPFSREMAAKERRARALRDASHRMYKVLAGSERRGSSPSPLSRKLTDIRGKAAAAAAAAAVQLAASQNDSERSAFLAQRMLLNMQAAEQRRLEAKQAQQARLAAKNELIMARLAEAQTRDQARRQQLLHHLHGRLAHADEVRRQHQRQAKRARSPLKSSSTLTLLPGTPGADEDWMEGLSPTTAASAAAFRATHSSRRLQRTWRRFAAQRKTTTQLARAFVALEIGNLKYPEDSVEDTTAAGVAAEVSGVSGRRSSLIGLVMIGGLAPSRPSPHHLRFEDFAAKLQSPATLRSAQALLRRLEHRLSVSGVISDGAQALLHQLNPSAPAGRQLDRYPVRVMLCAYMIREHPDVIFNTLGDVEAQLSAAADQFLTAFETLLARLVQPPPIKYTKPVSTSINTSSSCSSPPPTSPVCACPSPLTNSMVSYLKDRRTGGRTGQPPVARQLFGGDECTAVLVHSLSTSGSSNAPGTSSSNSTLSLAQLLVTFDDSWLEYLDQFVVWKGRDAAALERELTAMAMKLERSMRAKLGRREMDSPEVTGNPDLQAMVSQVSHDHNLLAERVARLTGLEGSARLHAALQQARQEVLAKLQAAEEAAALETGLQAEDCLDAGQRGSRSVARCLSRIVSSQGHLVVEDGMENGDQQTAEEHQGNVTQEQLDSLANEQLVWEMLYNPAHSLPTEQAEAAWYRALGKQVDSDAELDASEADSMTPEQLTAAVAHRARVIAERAFWDSIVWRFKTAIQGQGLPSQLSPLMAELGTELSGLLTNSLEAQQLSEQYTERAVLDRLRSRLGQQGGGANLTALGSMMEQLAQVLMRSGGDERAAEAADAVQRLQASMTAALAAAAATNGAAASANITSSATGGSEVAPTAAALATALVAALRLLMTHLKLVKLDAANTRLAGLARAMRERGAVSYLQTKLATAWQLPSAEDGSHSSRSPPPTDPAAIADKLPLTAVWLHQTQSDMVLQLRQSLSAAGLLLDQHTAAAAAVSGGLQSVELRSGVKPSLRAASSLSTCPGRTCSPGSLGAVAAVRPVFPVDLQSWRGAFRAGLVSLVTGNSPAASPNLPEVLRFDVTRLHDIQNTLQQLLVTAAGLLIIQQMRQATGLVWDAEVRGQARRRLMVVLADPGMKLSHLVTEISQLAGATAVATEQRVKTMFTTIVDPETAAFKRMQSAITSSLAAHLLYGRVALTADGAAASACLTLLGRVGAAALSDDVAHLGEQLARVAAVNEAVHGHLLAALAADTSNHRM